MSRAAPAWVAALALALLVAAAPAAAGGGGKPAKDGGKEHGKGHETAAPARPAPPPPPSPAMAAAPEADQPWRLIRALHRLQARLGEGDATAQAAQGDLIADLARRFDAAPPAVWNDRRNAAAQMMLLLSGADPRSARRRIEAGAFGAYDAGPRAGLAFAEGEAATARRLLAGLDPAQLDDLPRAYAALVAATLIAAGPAEGRAAAHDLFDRARLHAPGLLPEEAALRRQARLAEELGDRPRFARLAALHLRRYARSVYAPPFRARLPQALAALARDAATLADLAPLLDALTAAERGAALDRLAKTALAAGQADLARAAAARLAAEPEPQARQRARLYGLAAQALTGDAAVAADLAALAAADPDAEALRRAALDVARQVSLWPPPRRADAPPPPPLAAEARIRKALAEGERLLGGPPSPPPQAESAAR